MFRLSRFGIVLSFLSLMIPSGFAAASKTAQPAKPPFLMAVEDAFSIAGRGSVVTGRVERGEVKVGQKVDVVGLGATQKATVTTIEMLGKMPSSAKAGDSVGLVLQGVPVGNLKRGQVIAQENSIQARQSFTASIQLLDTAKGGPKYPLKNNYRPLVYLRSIDFNGSKLTLPKGMTELGAGAKATVTIELLESAALEKGQQFALREGGRTIGTGIVEK